jgi:hypothetical protein
MHGATSICFIIFGGESSELLEMQACLDWMFLLRCAILEISEF